MTFDGNPLFQEPEADRIAALKLPERARIAWPNVREADIEVLRMAPPNYIDTTHFDTVRFPPPPWAERRFLEAARDGSRAYSGYRGHEDILEEVAANVSRFVGVKLDPRKNLLLTPGTQAALFATLSARVNKGERIAVFDPDYLFTARIVGFLGAEAAYIPQTLDRSDTYVPDLGRLEEEFAKRQTRHLIFSHPNNPTGTVYPKATITAVAALARKYNISVIVDELYSRLVYDGTPFAHLAAEDGMMAHSATLLGPSKTESLSGYRVGLVAGNDRLISAIENVLSITSLRAPAYAQNVFKGWLAGDDNWLKSRIVEFKALRDSTAAALRQLPWLKLYPQQGTAYHWVDVSALGLPDAAVATTLLKQAGVLVSPGYQFGPQSAGHFRICYARDEKSWALALERMVSVLDGLMTRKRAG